MLPSCSPDHLFTSTDAVGKSASASESGGSKSCVDAVLSLHGRAWEAYPMQLRRAEALTRKAQAILDRPDLASLEPDLHLENLTLRVHCAALALELSNAADPDLPRVLADRALNGLKDSTSPLIAARVRYACSHVAIGLREFDKAGAYLRAALDLLPADDDPRKDTL